MRVSALRRQDAAQHSMQPMWAARRVWSMLTCATARAPPASALLVPMLASWLPSRPGISPTSHLRPATLRATVATLGTSTSVVVPAARQATRASPKQAPLAAKQVRQNVDFTALAACAHELQRDWVPAKVVSVVMSDKTTLMLQLRTLDFGSAWLAVSWHPMAGRVCISSPPTRTGSAAEEYSLGEVLSTKLCGLVLSGVCMPQVWERVVQLQFGVRPGEPCTHSLYCEIMARYSNVVFTSDVSNSILACAYQVGGAMSKLRLLQTGKPYQPPPVTQGIPPDSCSTQQEWQEVITRAAALTTTPARQQLQQGEEHTVSPLDTEAVAAVTVTGMGAAGKVAAGATRAFQGVSPALAAELCELAGVAGTTAVDSMDTAQWSSLWGHWQAWLQAVATNTFKPCSDPALTKYSLLGSLPVAHASSNSLLDTYYGSMQMGEVHIQLQQQLASAVAGALKKARKKVSTFEQQLESSADAERVHKQADMIVANLYRIKDGDAQVEAEDWDTGEVVTLPLDPQQPPDQSAQALYKRARKLRRAVAAVEPLLETARQDIAYLEEVEVAVGQLKAFSGPEDTKALQEVQEELVSQGYLRAPPDASLTAKATAKANKSNSRAARKGQGSKAAGAAGGFRSFVSPGGYTVLVGRNNKQNDDLSIKTASPEDLWLHLRSRPGSHVVIRVQSGKGMPRIGDADVQFAADLAAYFSKGRDDLKCDVLVCKAGALKKPKGARPGQVLVTTELGNVVARPGKSVAALEAAGATGT